MSSVKLQGNAGGAGAFTIQSPSSANTQTLTLPDATAVLVGDTATQTLTNKTLTSPTVTSPTISGAVMSSMASSVLTAGTAQASTSGTSIDFTSIPSWVKRITVIFSGVSTNGTSLVQVQIGSGSFTTAGYASGANWNGSGANSTTGFLTIAANSAGSTRHGALQLLNLTGNTWVASGAFGLSDSANGGGGGGTLALGGTLDRVRITTVNGTDTFDAGSINIQYE